MKIIWLITGLVQSVIVRLAALYFFIFELFLLKGIVPMAIKIQEGYQSYADHYEPFCWVVAGYFLYWLSGVIGNSLNGYCNYQAETIALKELAAEMKERGELS